jgi:hypothetical protein
VPNVVNASNPSNVVRTICPGAVSRRGQESVATRSRDPLSGTGRLRPRVLRAANLSVPRDDSVASWLGGSLDDQYDGGGPTELPLPTRTNRTALSRRSPESCTAPRSGLATFAGTGGGTCLDHDFRSASRGTLAHNRISRRPESRHPSKLQKPLPVHQGRDGPHRFRSPSPRWAHCPLDRGPHTRAGTFPFSTVGRPSVCPHSSWLSPVHGVCLHLRTRPTRVARLGPDFETPAPDGL